MHVLSDHDRRQTDLMLSRIELFERKELSLQRIVTDLDGLFNAVESGNDSWRRSFQAEWGKLEDVYASMLTSNAAEAQKSIDGLPSETAIIVERALTELKELIALVAKP